MKRLIYPSTASAIAWWATNPNALKADCFAISLPTGQTIYATSGQWDLTIPESLSPTGTAMTFSAYQYGSWTRGKITSEAGFRCSSNNMTLSVAPKTGATYPGLSLSIQNAAFNHLFDGAQVWVWTVYMPFGEYGTIQIVETKFQGRIIKSPQIGRVLCSFEVGDPFFLLNQKVPSRLLQSNCYKSFADSNCGLSAANYTVSFTGHVVSQTTLQPTTAFTQPNGYFTQGVVTCMSGQNSGLSQTIKSHVSGVLTTMVPWIMPVAVGDTFSVIKGCDQTPTTCAGMKRANGVAEPANWQLRFGGTPYMPPPSASL
jgi:uncharacterized phage protein (TIGR02218 family)